MAYKDKEKQKEVVRLATRRYRQRLKGITGITGKGVTVIPITIKDVIPIGTIKRQSYNPMMVGYVPPRDTTFDAGELTPMTEMRVDPT